MTTSKPIDPLNAIENKIFVSFDESPDEPPMNIYPSRVGKPAPWQRPTLSNPPDHDNPQGYLPKAHLVIVPDELPY